jgi:hypothetical protein
MHICTPFVFVTTDFDVSVLLGLVESDPTGNERCNVVCPSKKKHLACYRWSHNALHWTCLWAVGKSITQEENKAIAWETNGSAWTFQF